jgi:hypothetical protein
METVAVIVAVLAWMVAVVYLLGLCWCLRGDKYLP